MQRKFQYMVIGTGLTLLVIFGALTLLLPLAQASNSTTVPANESGLNTSPDVFLNEEPSIDSISEESRPGSKLDMANIPETHSNTSVSVNEEREGGPNLGTADHPETDVSKILEQIMILVEKNEANLFGKPGWLYEKHEHYWPLEYASNTGDIYGVPVTELFGTDTVTREEWYEIDAQGYYQQKVGLTTDANGIIRTQWATTNGYFVSLELIDVTEHAVHPADTFQKAPLGSDFPAYLEMVQSEEQTSITAWQDAEQYVVVITKVHVEPIVNVIGEREQSTQVKYQFNLETGAIQLFEVTYQTVDGDLILRERSLLLEQGVVENLHTKAAQVLSEASMLTEEN